MVQPLKAYESLSNYYPFKRPYVIVSNDPQVGDFGPFTPGTQTAGIQEAINYVQALGGGMVFIRKGTYNPQAQILVLSGNIRILGEGRGVTVIQPAANISYQIPFNPLFVFGIDFNLNIHGNIRNVEVAHMTVYPSPIGSTSSEVFIGFGGILPSDSHFHDLQSEGTTGSDILLEFGLDPTIGYVENVVIENIWDHDSHPIDIQTAFPDVPNAQPSSSSTNNLRNLTIAHIYSTTDISLGDDKIAIFGSGAVGGNYIDSITIEDIHILITPTGEGVNGIKLDIGTGCRFLNLAISKLWFMNYGTFLSNATFPLTLEGTGATSSTVASVENVIVEKVYTYNANTIQVFAPYQLNGYVYPNPFCVYRDINIWETQSTGYNGILLFSPNNSPSGVLESLLLENVNINGWNNTGGALAVMNIFNTSAVTWTGNIIFKHVRAINMGSNGGDIPLAYIGNVSGAAVKGEDLVGVNYPFAAPSISPNPPGSGEVYQNGNNLDIELIIPVTLNPTSTAAASAVLQIASGLTSTGTLNNPLTVDTETAPAGLASGFVKALKARIPAGWYYELTLTNAVASTATVLPA